MKNLLKFIFVIALLYAVGCKKEQNTIIKSIEKGLIIDTMIFQELTREYIVYIPEIYDGTDPVPLMLNFHGLGGHMMGAIDAAKYDVIADRENFILVSPQGFNSNWNFNGSSSPDDLGFVSALIDTISTQYNIDIERVYATGFSNGIRFSFELACYLNDRIAAIGGGAGYMTTRQLEECNPARPIPVIQIHGTWDARLHYSGVQQSLNFWIDRNQTSATPIITAIPDIDTTDNSTVEHHLYADGIQGITIEHFKVIHGGHDWPGFNNANMDIDASEEVWRFISQFNRNGKIN